jgi:superfamily II DNA or RNA helicase
MTGTTSFSLGISPRGHLHVVPGEPGTPPIPPDVGSRIAEAFRRGPGEGLLHLGAVEVAAVLPPVLTYWRDLGHLFMERLCAVPELDPKAPLQVGLSSDHLESRGAAAPPMSGGEYLTPEVLEDLWGLTKGAAESELHAWKGDVASWLRSKNEVWNLVGRVWFHLAEKKGDERTPFAFLATYTARLAGASRVKHLPLGRALQEYAGAREKERLLALLAPLHRAAGRSSLVATLLESGEVFHPIAFTVREAHVLLRDIPVLEECGLVVRVPNWWNPRRPRRVSVTLTVGSEAPASIGLGALLDFSVEPTLDGETLDQEEWDRLLAGADGLAFLRGKWVEVDRTRLAEVLGRWRDLKKAMNEGVPFAEAMRLLSGVSLGATSEGDVGTAETASTWSRVEAGEWLRKVLAELKGPASDGLLDPGEGLETKLRPYQEVGVRWLFALGRLGLGACLADDMGLGKTIQVLALFLALRRQGEKGPFLLVVPASLIANWQAEIDRFAPRLSVFVAHSSATPRDELVAMKANGLPKKDVVITTYGSLLRLPWLKEATWSAICLDEAQAIKNPGARQTRAAKALKGRIRLALTGTPVENRLSDLWSIFDFLSPGLLGSAAQFTQLSKRMASRTPPDYGPLRSLVRPYILRRMKTDRSVIADLPDKTEMKAFCPLTKAQAALYQRTVDELRRLLTTLDGMQRRGVVLAFLMRFKQICNHPSHWTGDGGWDPTESGKFGRLASLCEEIASRQEKALVFTQFRETTEPLARYLAGLFGREGLVLHGQTPVGQRKKLVDAFQAEDGPPFFVLSVKAGGTGLNLTAASHVIHFDRWWNPAVEDQATDRAFRIGQKRNVLVHKLICRGTVEERIDALIEGKRSLSRELLDGGAETLITEMTNDEILKLVSLDVTSALVEA